MESLLPQFNTISLIHPMSSATSHLLEQRQFLSTQPLVIEFEGVWDDDESEDTLDLELNFYNNNFKQTQNINNNNNNNSNNNNNNNNIISNENNNINNYQIETISKHLKKLEKEGHIKIPKSLNFRKSHQSGFQIKKNSFIRDKKLISISNTMKNNIFHCLIK
ncbi:hypothetical protein DDB_G0279623 [Dictyostelium discoideum AX4]|uniref:Uncharacterized protein n=1 Tax=Dictyostelium discoideum TaxID=44689 RepID=Q54WJ4_DICDI|nr:hypothetical protein DDB_G0279623 [Dictyostelium discoideum AX4]EAL67586.1 hypothetical protein DDB_G0279623 [Dictyostelium discoideum AX4]|eukprot:XP_641559.1 hypothetical protein DDB_G0279623 [Dictyostelium discoideum AX4]